MVLFRTLPPRAACDQAVSALPAELAEHATIAARAAAVNPAVVLREK